MGTAASVTGDVATIGEAETQKYLAKYDKLEEENNRLKNNQPKNEKYTKLEAENKQLRAELDQLKRENKKVLEELAIKHAADKPMMEKCAELEKQNRKLRSGSIAIQQKNKKLVRQLSSLDSKTEDDKDDIDEQSALVFDCGTGETKAMRFTYTKGIGVTLEQTGSAPAVLSFLEGDKKIKDLMKKPKKGKPAPDPTMFFLKGKPAVAEDYCISEGDFLAFVGEQRKAYGNLVNTIVVGSSSWLRSVKSGDSNISKEVQTRANVLVNDLVTKMNTVCQNLSQKEEGVYEATSVAYAVAALSNGNQKIDGVLGSGGGSVQYMHKMKNVVGLECGHKFGINAVNATYKRVLKETQDEAKAVDAALQMSDDYANAEIGMKKAQLGYSRLTYELAKAGVINAKVKSEKPDKRPFPPPKVADPSITQKLEGGTIVCISACYYAAQAVGIKNAPGALDSHPVEDVLRRFADEIAKIEASARKDWAKFSKDRKRGVMTLVNLKLQTRLLDTFFSPTTQLIFKRDWKLHKSVPKDTDYRTTWTAGWFLHFLQGLGITFDGSRDVLEKLNDYGDDGIKKKPRKKDLKLVLTHSDLRVVRESQGKKLKHLLTDAAYILDIYADESKELTMKWDGKHVVMAENWHKPKGLLRLVRDANTTETKTDTKTDTETPEKVYDLTGLECFLAKEKRGKGKKPATLIGLGGWYKKNLDHVQAVKCQEVLQEFEELGASRYQPRNVEVVAYEAAAASYAVSKFDPKIKKINGVLGVRADGIQYMHDMTCALALECGIDDGVQAMRTFYDRTIEANKLARITSEQNAIDEALEVARDYALNRHPASKEQSMACSVLTAELNDKQHSSISKSRSKTKKARAASMAGAIKDPWERLGEGYQPYPMAYGLHKLGKGDVVVCLSSCFYAAKYALGDERDDKGEAPIVFHTALDMVKLFQDKLKVLEAKAREDYKDFFGCGVAGSGAYTYVNLLLQTRLYQTFFHPKTKLIFKRNWLLPGSPPNPKQDWNFRTTWSAGWFLYLLRKQGVYLTNDSEDPLIVIDDLNHKAVDGDEKDVYGNGSLPLTEEQEVWRKRAKKREELLIEIYEEIQDVQATALKFAKEVTPILTKVARHCSGMMKGLDFKIKSAESMTRKLEAKIRELYIKHDQHHDWHPKVGDCLATIRDSLRYTILFPPDQYFEGIKQVEAALFDGEDAKPFSFGGIARKALFKNFWQDTDDMTTYMGINALIWCKNFEDVDSQDFSSNEIKDSDSTKFPSGYVFELQFHTPASFRLKDNESHIFYEAWRDPKITSGCVPPLTHGKREPPGAKKIHGQRYKDLLFDGMKSMWDVLSAKGEPKFECEIYNGVEYRPFKPIDTEALVKYKGMFTHSTRREWEGQNYKGFYYKSEWENRQKC